MKIAIPTKGNVVDAHYGHCEAYTIFTINENKEIVSSEKLPAPKGCGCKTDIAAILEQKGVSVLLAGNMGDGALNELKKHNIEVYRGNSGDVRKLTEYYLQGNLADSGKSCDSHDSHEAGHQCSN